MLARLTRALQIEAERQGSIEANGIPAKVTRSFALTSDPLNALARRGVPDRGLRPVRAQSRVRVFTVTVTEERSR